MIAALNLASEPFRNRALPWSVATLLSLIAIVALSWIMASTRATTAEAERADATLAQLNEQTGEIRQRAEALKQQMPAEDLRTLQAAHDLVDRKRFSWSNLFADLEAAIPPGVRVTRIGVRDVVQTSPDVTIAELNLIVIGRTPTDVTDMIAEMNRGATFAATPLAEEVRRGRGEQGTEWTISITYRPPVARPISTPQEQSEGSVARMTDSSSAVSTTEDADSRRFATIGGAR